MTSDTATQSATREGGRFAKSASQRPRGRNPRKGPSRTAAAAAIVLTGIFTFLPIYWLVTTAVVPDSEAYSFPARLWPGTLTLSHFRTFFSNSDFVKYFINSAIVSVITALLAVMVAAYCAYSLSKFEYRGRKSLMYMFLGSQLFPHVLLIVTLYQLYNTLGLLNTYLGLVLAFSSFTLPLCIFTLRAFFNALPTEVIEAAKIDGASHWTIIHRIVLPLVRPALVTAGLYAFIISWNDFIFALTLSGPRTRTLPTGLVEAYIGQFQRGWGDLMAASLVVSMPTIIIFLFMQRQLISGALAGAVKA